VLLTAAKAVEANVHPAITMLTFRAAAVAAAAAVAGGASDEHACFAAAAAVHERL
jgi:hypothetical protein